MVRLKYLCDPPIQNGDLKVSGSSAEYQFLFLAVRKLVELFVYMGLVYSGASGAIE